MMSVSRENLFDLFMHYLPGIAFIKDLAGRYHYVNDQWKRIAPAGTICAWHEKTSYDLWPEPVACRFDESDRKVIAESAEIQAVEAVETETGTRHWVVSKFPIRDEAGEVALIGGIGFDVTDRLRAEEELRLHQERLASLAVELSVAEERERNRIAGELHDQVGQNLFLAGIKLAALRDSSPPDQDCGALDEIGLLIGQALRDIRSLTFQLRPPLLAHDGLVAALVWLAEQFREDFGLQVEIHDDRREKPLSPEISSTVFQTVRELLLNVAKHAAVRRADITIMTEADIISVTVEDGGAGFDVSTVWLNRGKNGGFGLFNVRQKIEYLGGTLAVDAEPGRGTRTVIRVPLRVEVGGMQAARRDALCC